MYWVQRNWQWNIWYITFTEKMTNNYLQLTSLVIMQVKRSTMIKPVINNHGNWTEWSAIWSEIIRLILKSHIWFEITSMISDQNCTTQSPITILLQPFWNRRIQSVPIFIWTSSWFVEKQKQKGFYISFCTQNRNDAI